MTRISIRSLQLTNFKGTQSRRIEFGGPDVPTEIAGANGTGKTTIADAWLWLLFDMDSAGHKGADACKTTAGAAFAHFLTHEVSAEIDADGRSVSLRKALDENWVKPRGKAQQEFSGNMTSYWVDDVPYQKKDWDVYIDKLVPVGLFKILSDPMYFSTVLHYKERLEILMQLVGGITDAEIAEGDAELSAMLVDRGEKTMDEYKRMLLEKIRRIKADIDGIPARIDENRRSISGVEPNYSEAEITRAALQAKLDVIEAEKSSLKAAVAAAEEKYRSVIGLKNKRDSLIRQIVTEKNADRSEAERTLIRMSSDHRNRMLLIEGVRGGVEAQKRNLSDTNVQLENFRGDWKADAANLGDVKRRTFDASSATLLLVCPTCGQSMPESSMEEQVANLQKHFDEETARTVSEIEKHMQTTQNFGKAAKAKVEEISKLIADAEAMIKSDEEEAAKIAAAFSELTTKFASTPEFTVEMAEFDLRVKDIDEQIAKAQAEYDAVGKPEDPMQSSRDAEIVFELDRVKAILAQKDRRDSIVKRISELTEELRTAQSTADKLDGMLFQVGRYTTVRSEKLERKINDIFSEVSFRFFSEQINGGVSDACEAIVGQTTFGKANTAAQVNAGLNIINVLSDFHGHYVPVFCDRVESINHLIGSSSQQIRLVVNEDETIRIDGVAI